MFPLGPRVNAGREIHHPVYPVPTGFRSNQFQRVSRSVVPIGSVKYFLNNHRLKAGGFYCD